ncbi:unnamed protein product, partial [Ixodes hexagonus]
LKAAFWGASLLLGMLLVVSAVVVVFRHEIFAHRRQPRVPSYTALGNYSMWAAVTGNKQCNHVPRKIMSRDGTIADVVVATMLCVCVVQPHRCGIGGGFFAVYYNHSGRTALAFNAREMAPEAATSDMFFQNSTSSLYGFRACAVPGELMGYARMLQVIGSNVPWGDLFEDAIHFARDGVTVYEDLERELMDVEERVVSDAALCAMLCSRLVNGSVLRVGETLRNPALADTLTAIANGSYLTFYDGPVGSTLVNDIKRNGGIMTARDLRDFRAEVSEAVQRTLHDNVSIWVPPAPSGGPLLSFMIAVMDSYRQERPGGSSGGSLEDSDETIHRFVETIKFTLAKRMEIGDPVHIDIQNALEQLGSDSFLAEVKAKIRGTPFSDLRYYGVRYQKLESHGTGHIVVLMPDGDALALMGSINWRFGALALSASTGILLNNEMNDFAIPGEKNAFGLPPSHVNYIRPGKRPTSSIAPLVMTDPQGDVSMVVSAAGAFSIITGSAQVVMRTLWMNHTIKEAIDAPRVHHQLFPDEVMAETNID